VAPRNFVDLAGQHLLGRTWRVRTAASRFQLGPAADIDWGPPSPQAVTAASASATASAEFWLAHALTARPCETHVVP
jgi:hypothetical protein